MNILDRLAVSSSGMHFADQIALVSVPLIAALVFNASVEVIGILVAAQSMAHLLGSLPCGLAVERVNSQRLAISATLISTLGFSGAAFSIVFDNLLCFGLAVTFGGFGVVFFVLVSLSIVPKIAHPEQLAQANSRIEIPRAIASFAVPLTVGLVISEATVEWIFFAAALGGLLAFKSALGLPGFEPASRKQISLLKSIEEGGKFVLNHELLFPISACAIFWNLAFSALLVLLVPLMIDEYLFDPGAFGIALSAFGIAAICGAWTAGRLSRQIPPSVFLLFGPGSSVVASTTLLLVPKEGSEIVVYAAFFLLGYGPSMWLVTQNSIRQLVAPAVLLGRVNAVIQTAIYGVRPLGALLGGVVVTATSPRSGLIFVVACFLGSFSVAQFSRLRSVNRYSDLACTVLEQP